MPLWLEGPCGLCPLTQRTLLCWEGLWTGLGPAGTGLGGFLLSFSRRSAFSVLLGDLYLLGNLAAASLYNGLYFQHCLPFA